MDGPSLYCLHLLEDKIEREVMAMRDEEELLFQTEKYPQEQQFSCFTSLSTDEHAQE